MSKETYHYFFRNLSLPSRIDIVSALKEKEGCVNELSRKLKVEQSKLSHSLASMKCCNIVEVKKKGKHRIYSLNKKTIVPILKILDKHEKDFCKECRMRK